MLAPHLSQFMTTFTAGEVNLEPTPRRGIRRCRPPCRLPGPGPTSIRTTSITQLDRRRRNGDQCSLWAESCRCAVTVGRQDSSASTGDLLCPLHVDSSRPERANTGHSRRLGERVISTRSRHSCWVPAREGMAQQAAVGGRNKRPPHDELPWSVLCATSMSNVRRRHRPRDRERTSSGRLKALQQALAARPHGSRPRKRRRAVKPRPLRSQSAIRPDHNHRPDGEEYVLSFGAMAQEWLIPSSIATLVLASHFFEALRSQHKWTQTSAAPV